MDTENTISTKRNNTKYPLSNQEVLNYFTTKPAQKLFRDLYLGRVWSERHDIMWEMFTRGRIDKGFNTSFEKQSIIPATV